MKFFISKIKNFLLKIGIKRTLVWLVFFLTVFGLVLAFIWSRVPERVKNKTLGNEKIKEQVVKSFEEIPNLEVRKEGENFVMEDTLSDGIEIKYANENENSAFQNLEKTKENFKINFPVDYEKPIEVKLDQERVITIKDNNGGKGLKGKLLTNSTRTNTEFTRIETGGRERLAMKDIKDFTNRIFNPDSKAQIVNYQDERKKIIYAYQKDQGTGEKKLKNWVVYEKGSGTEKESYSFENAKLRKNDSGEIEVYYFGQKEIQNEQVKAEVDSSLLKRAQEFLKNEIGEDIERGNQNPDFVIPTPFYLDKNGEKFDLDWSLSEDRKTISLEIKMKSNKDYPIALDPTLQFTAPGQSNSGSVITGETGSEMGHYLVSGDFNADGRTDLAVGARIYSSNTGRVYIFYNDGLIPNIAFNADVIITAETGLYYGNPLAAGDFNADGRTDLAVGAYAYSSNTGRVYIFYNNGSIPTTADVIITGETTNNYFGCGSLASGDFNADGRTDLAVGAWGYSSNTGRAYIFYNDGSIPTTAATADVIITGQTTNNYFGWFLTSGDFNADGRTDLAVGAHGYSTDTGRAYIFYNDGSIPTTAATADVIITGEATYNYFGVSIVSGDFNADGRTDLAVGAELCGTNTGRAYIFYNDGSIPTTATTADVIITGEATNNYFGRSLTSGDFNADGRTDLAVGARGYSSNIGRTYIFYNDGSIPTTAATADVIITGEATNNYFGWFLTSGDFNADGKTDLAVGSYGYSSNTGRTYVFYSQNGQVNTNFNIQGESSSQFGYSLASGDFNADGRTDLAVGADAYSSSTGRVYIFHNDGSIPTTAASADVIITGEATNNYFGTSITSGDFNADGRTDLAVGAYGYSSNTGRAYIFHNDGSIPTTAASADIIITGQVTSNYFGNSLTSGDFNTDGRIDLVVGARGYSSVTGRVYIFHNDGSIPTTAASADVIITGEGTNNAFGWSLASGDFNADGRTDLAVGAIYYSTSTGRAYIFHNDGSIPTTAASADVIITGEGTNNDFGISFDSGDFNADGRTDLAVGGRRYSGGTGRVYIFYNDGSISTTAATADVIITGESSLHFGYSLTSGDFNADGRTDLAVGAINYSTSTGRVYIFHNDGSIPTTAASADVIITGEATSNYFGYSLTSGDFNADGRIDLAVGADGYSSNTGRIYVYETRENFVWKMQPQKSFRTDRISGQEMKITGESSSQFGYSLVSGDFNADGKIDLAVGANVYSSGTGRVYIFLSDGSISTSAASADIIITGESSSEFGRSLVSGDFNSDGRTDLAVGAYWYSSGTGRTYIFYNDGSIPTTAATADVIINGETGSYFGISIASGDFNLDGRTDLAVGANWYSSNTGRAYIFYNDGSIPTTAATADVIITGEATNNYFGTSLASGDFNADGRTDLAVGAYAYSSNTGRAYIFHNDGSIPTTAASADVIITGESSSGFGCSLASGDFNADGRIDLVVGAQYYSSGTGRVYIFHNDGSIPTTAATADVIITGEATTNYFGSSLAAGDFNADGRTDLAVGANGYSTNTGRTYIFYNDGSIPTTAPSADVIITGETTSNFFGYSLTAGDFNADGRTDLVVGAITYSSNAGRLYLYTFNDALSSGESSNNYLGCSLVSGDFNADGRIDLAVGAYGYSSNTGRAYIFHNDGSIPTTAASADVIITGETTINYFGKSLAAGDFNADGRTDLAVGADGYSSSTGRAYIFYNDGSIPTTAATADVIITGESTTNSFGGSLVSGDFNADGRTDLAAGALSYSSGTGRAYIFHNDGSIPTTAASADVIITGEATMNFFGRSLVAGDFNADGRTDLVVGAERYSSDTGRAYIFYNDGSIPTTATSADVIITGETTDNRFGYSLESGDFNADGRTDLAVGAQYYSSYTGRVYIFHNDGSIPTTATSADVIITGETTDNCFGYSLESGDFNADGRTDLAVGADGYSSSTGRSYIFHNDGSIPTTAASADVIITGEATSNYFGYSLTSGDFNADGKIDLAVGANGYSSNAGRFYVYISETKAKNEGVMLKIRGSNKLRGTGKMKFGI